MALDNGGLRLRQCTKRYGHVLALDGVGLDVLPGSIVGLIGPNGAGKTTLLHGIMGLVKLDDGEMSVDGWSTRKADGKRLMAFMPDELPRPVVLTGFELLEFTCHLYEKKLEGVAELAERLELGAALKRPLAAYSHGMRRKIDLMAALIVKPRVLVLDEPFSGMDPIAVDSMFDILAGFRDGGGAILLSSHDLELAKNLADCIVMLDLGKVVFAGEAGKLMDLHGTLDMRRAFMEHVGGG